MDVESSRNEASSNNTSADEGIVVSNEECRCCLERLLLEEDFHHLASLLHAAIWQRFCLLKDDRMVVVSEGNVEQKPHALMSQGVHDHYIDRVCSMENSESMLPGCSSDMPHETETSLKLMNSAVLQHHVGPVSRSFAVMESSSNVSSPSVDSSVLFSPWFVQSAVFAGCPKLLHYLLSTFEARFQQEAHESNVNRDVSNENLHDVASVGSSLDGARDGNQTFDVPPALHESSSYSQPCRQLVNRRIACEFPLTDSWIHDSVNLMVSPLHLACWRHDFASIILLLQHGADPNGLALEEVAGGLRYKLFHTDSADTTQESFIRLCDKLWFYTDRGLSPLHFIALGLRSPPRHSVLKGCEDGIIHDICSLFQQLNKVDSSDCNEMLPDLMLNNSPVIDYSKLACFKEKSGQCNIDKNDEIAIKCDLVVNCLEVLLRAGADPNLGQSLILNKAYALDIILQPPTKVYYAPSAARGNQSSESLRLHDLEYNANQVVAAIDLLLCHDAQLSPKFLATHMWRPELLDCFHLGNPHHGQQLVQLLIRLGVFSERYLYDLGRGPDAGLPSISVFTSVCIQRFIADVMNTSISASLTNLILNWCSVNMLHDFIRTITKIAQMSNWNEALRELLDAASCLQMRSLKHSCFLVILSSIRHRFSAVWSLPLPVPLKRELTNLHI